MPKLKTRKAMKKRFRITKNGKVLVHASFRRHLLTDRTSKRRRQSRAVQGVDPTDQHRIIRAMPYDRKG